MMEAVKIARLDLVECLVRAGARLDVQVSEPFPAKRVLSLCVVS